MALLKIKDEVRHLVEDQTLPSLPSELCSGRDWCVLSVRTGKEPNVTDGFRKRGYRAYWPNYPILKPSRTVANGRLGRNLRRVGVMKATIFVQVRPGHPLPFVYSDLIIGLLGPIRTSTGDPFVLWDADVERLRLIETALNMPVDDERQKQWIEEHTRTVDPGLIDVRSLVVGEKLVFRDGVLKGWGTARYVRLERRDRIVVEINATGQALEITVPLYQVERP